MLFPKLCTKETLYNAWQQVKAKNAAGGIDGFTTADFEKEIDHNLNSLQNELQTHQWNPEPYLRIEINKNDTEKRKLGLLTIKDKIVQQAVLTLINESFEKMFLNNSYAYRKGKGHLKAVRRTINEFKSHKSGWVLKLDIDDYFDTINHDLLFSRLKTVIMEEEIVRLIELSIKMGVVTKNMKWNETKQGVPQGAILSPLLANFYLHPFDQFVTAITTSYIRYADDFLIITDTQEEALKLSEEASAFLQNELLLKLNLPIMAKIEDGVNFLGVFINSNSVAINDNKKNKLLERIRSIRLTNEGFSEKSLEGLEGIKRYYAQILPQDILQLLDQELIATVNNKIEEKVSFILNKKILSDFLIKVPFFSQHFESGKREQFTLKRKKNYFQP